MLVPRTWRDPPRLVPSVWDDPAAAASGFRDVAVDATNLFLMHGEDLAESGNLAGTLAVTGSTAASSSQKKWGTKSISFVGDGELQVQDVANGSGVHPTAFNLGIDPTALLDLWFRPSSFGSGIRVLVAHERNGPNWWRLGMSPTANLIYTIESGGSDLLVLTSTLFCTVLGWNHAVVAKYAGTTWLGLNGRIEAVAADHYDYSTIGGAAAGSFRMGSGAVSGDPFVGYLDEARMRRGAALIGTPIVGGTYPVPTGPYV